MRKDEKTGHIWEKTNLVTKKGKSLGMYDVYTCVRCGEKYKRTGLDWNPPTTQCKGMKSSEKKHNI